MEIDHKIDRIHQSLQIKKGTNVIPDDVIDALIVRLQSLSYFLSGNEFENQNFSSYIDTVLDELSALVDEFNSISIFQKLQNSLPGSKLTKLKQFIPKLLEITDEIVRLYVQKTAHYIQDTSPKILSKKTLKDSELIEIETSCHTFSRIPDLDLRAYNIILTYDESIQKYVPPSGNILPVIWKLEPYGLVYNISRDKFAFLPPFFISKLSRDHARIIQKIQGGQIYFEVVDLSRNGIYFLGNKASNEKSLIKLEKNEPFRAREGDIFALLCEKSKMNIEKVLIYFEIGVACSK